jgi:RNA recognition motif-containing protein
MSSLPFHPFSRAAPHPSHRNPSEHQSHTLFVRNLPYQIPAEELLALYRQFGEIAAADTAHLHDRGLAFVSFFDKRAAAQAVERMQHFQSRGRNVVTGFAPQQFEASELLVRPMKIGLPKPSIEICRSVLCAFGEIEKLRSVTEGFVVEFFDIRAARNARANSGRIVIGGVFQWIEPFGQSWEQSGYTAATVYPPPAVYPQAGVYPTATVSGQAVPESIRASLRKLQEKLKPLS